MRDSKAREEIAGMKKDLEHLSKEIDRVDLVNYEFLDYRRRITELARELGLVFDEDGVLNREATVNSSLGRLQAQITALVDATGFKETYVEVYCVTKKRDKRYDYTRLFYFNRKGR